MKNININAPFNQTSYGITSHNILRHLCLKGCDVSVWPIGGQEYDSQAYPDQQELVKTCDIKGRFFVAPNAPSVRIFHQFSLAERIGKGPHIGFPIFELDRFADHELNHLNSVDELFVTSNWSKEVIESNSIKVPCHIVPLGYDPDIFKPIATDHLTSGKFTVCNWGKWEYRKGHDVLPHIFYKAFGDNQDVEFVMGCHNPFLNSSQVMDFQRPYRELLGNRVKFLPRMNSQMDVNTILNMCDCLIFPSRAEGWNLELLEAMAIGKPCIATAYSAHLDFAGGSYLVTIDEKETANDGIWFHGQGNWAKIGPRQVDQCVDYLRFIYKERPTPNNEFARKFTWENTANKIIQHLTEQ